MLKNFRKHTVDPAELWAYAARIQAMKPEQYKPFSKLTSARLSNSTSSVACLDHRGRVLVHRYTDSSICDRKRSLGKLSTIKRQKPEDLVRRLTHKLHVRT